MAAMASFSAASTASVPELLKNTRSMRPGASSLRRWASWLVCSGTETYWTNVG